MPYQSVPVESFSGLNLNDDPGTVGWGGAIDLLNVDSDRPGRIRSRDGYAAFTGSAAAGTYHSLDSFYRTDGTKVLVAAFGGGSGAISIINTSGTVVASQSFVNNTFASVARVFDAALTGREGAFAAVSGSGAATVYETDGTVWTTPIWSGTTPDGRHLAYTPWDSRTVNARRSGTALGNNPSTVLFSDPGTPRTWGANNYVDINPGDGEEITAMCAWRDLLFVFKEAKVAVFYGTSTDSSGNPIFNYRLVAGQGLPSAGGSSAYRALAPSPAGVFFLNRRGVWITTGGPPTLVSTAIDPIFRGAGASSFFQGSALNQAQVALCSLHWHDNRLYIAYPSGSSTYNDRLIVHDPSTGTWMLWDIPCADLASFRIGNNEELVFAYATGTNNIGRHNLTSGYTQDGGNGTSTGAAITSRYRSGFNTLPPSLRADGKRVIRQWGLRGSGTVTFGVAADDAVAIPTTAGGAQSSVSLTAARPNFRTSQIGNNASWQVSSTSAWRLDSLQADLA